MSFKLTRNSTTDVALTAPNSPNPVPLPAAFFTSAETADGDFTNPNGNGVQAVNDGTVELAASFAVGLGGGNIATHYRYEAGMWALFINGAPATGPLASGQPITVPVNAGDQLRAGLVSLYPKADETTSGVDVRKVGGNGATFVGRYV